MRNVRIAVDWDGTVWSIVDQWRALSNNPQFSYDDCHTWEHPVHWAGGLDAFKALLLQGHAPQAMVDGRDQFVFAGAISTLLELQQAGAQLTLLTARHETEIVSVLSVLSHHGFTPDLVASRGPNGKAAYCLANQHALLIDDHPGTVRAAHAARLPVTGLRHPYVAPVFDELGIPSAHTWQQLRPLIYQLAGLTLPRSSPDLA